MEPISRDTDHLIVLSTLPCHTVDGENPEDAIRIFTQPSQLSTIPTCWIPLYRW